MLETIYPEEEQRFFTNREHLLALLGYSRDLLTQGVRKHLALSGFRRVGKTVVLKEFLRRNRSFDHHSETAGEATVFIAYVDLPRLALTPESFSTQYLGYLLYWMAGTEDSRPEVFLTPAYQLTLVGGLGHPDLTDYILRFHQELQKERPDQHLLLEMAFNAPEVYAQATGCKVMFMLDEFPEILALNNYPQVKDILGLFRAVLQSQSNVCYMVAGSMISLMEHIFLDAESPLFVHFQIETVSPFGQEDSDALARKRLAVVADPVPADVLATVYQVTRGHPFYIYATCMRVLENITLLNKPLNPQTVQEAFTLETLGTNGRIYNLCRYILEQSLQEVRGETMPQAILQVLAQEPGGMSLSEIASQLKRPSGAIRQVLNWLMDVDLVEQHDDKSYGFRDPVLQVWVAYYYSGLQLTGLPSAKVLSSLVAELMEKYQRVTSELGIAKESQVRELLHKFKGQEIDAALLGLSGVLRLPIFDQVDPYLSPDGQIEVDALAVGSERWAIEIKWRGKLSGRKALEKMANAAKSLSARPWHISKAGFTPDAITFARQNGMMISDQAAIEALVKFMI